MTPPSASQDIKANLSEASAHLKSAASAAGEAFKSAAGVAGEELKQGKTQVKAELADGARSGAAAAEQGKEVARERMDALMDKGRDVVDSAAGLIRERPLVSLGVAFAAGWLIAKLGRSSD